MKNALVLTSVKKKFFFLLPLRLLSKTVQYSDDSENGEGQRKRFRLSREEEATETGSGGVMQKKKKKKKKSWIDQELSSSHPLEVTHFTAVFE